MEGPDEPDVGKALQSPDGVGIAVGRRKDHLGLQGVHQAALPGHAEFCGEVAADVGNGMHGEEIVHERPPLFQWFFTYTMTAKPEWYDATFLVALQGAGKTA